MPYVFKITQRSPHTSLQGRQLRLVLAYQLEIDGKLVGIVTLGRTDTFLMPLDFVDAETWRSLTIPVEVPPMQVSTLIDMPHKDDYLTIWTLSRSSRNPPCSSPRGILITESESLSTFGLG